VIYHRISDWDNAYSNGINIPNGNAWPDAWVAPSTAYRENMLSLGRAELALRYGEKPRNVYDLFLPENPPRGVVVFIHGGYWQSLDNSYWSHLAEGPIQHGFAVAMPTYTLCPEVHISDIVIEIGTAISTITERFDGPIHLTGHSAGGHLVSRMVSATSPLAPAVRSRIGNTVSISGVHDLRPLMRTNLNERLRITPEEAQRESPVLLEPGLDTRLFCWVGGNERDEFLRQNHRLASIWTGLGAETGHYAEPDKHHFTVPDGLMDPKHLLTRTLVGA
jgi:acetyl esterase/lipase